MNLKKRATKFRTQQNPLEYIKSTLAEYIDTQHTRVVLFGSRATNSFRSNSDFDIGLFSSAPIPLSTLFALHRAFEECPWKVDIIDFSQVSDEFKKNALQTAISLY